MEHQAAPGNAVQSHNVRWQDKNSEPHQNAVQHVAMHNTASPYCGSAAQGTGAPQQQHSYGNRTGAPQSIVNNPYSQQQLSNALHGMELAPEQGLDSRQHGGAAPSQSFQHDRQQSYQPSYQSTCHDRMRPPVVDADRAEKQWRPSSAVPPLHTTTGAGGYHTSVRNANDQRTQSVARDMAIQTSESVRHVDPTTSGSRDRLTAEEHKYGVTFRAGVLPKPIWLGSLENAETAKDRMRQ